MYSSYQSTLPQTFYSSPNYSLPGASPLTSYSIPQSTPLPLGSYPPGAPPPPSQKSPNPSKGWVIASLVIIFILTIGLVIAVYFNFNTPVTYETGCVTCCDNPNYSLDYLECYNINRNRCRDMQISGGCNIENTALITGPFILFSMAQSTAETPTNTTINPTSILSVQTNPMLSGPDSLSMAPYLSQAENIFTVDIYGFGNMVRVSNLTEVLTISQLIYTVVVDTVTYNLNVLGFHPLDNIPDGFIVPVVRFAGGRVVLEVPSLNGFTTFWLIAVHSEDPVFSSVFTTSASDDAAIFATPQNIPQETSPGVLNPLYAQTVFTPYYVFQDSP